MKPIAVRRSWEKNSRAGPSFWLLFRIVATVRGIPKGSGQTSSSTTAIIIFGYSPPRRGEGNIWIENLSGSR